MKWRVKARAAYEAVAKARGNDVGTHDRQLQEQTGTGAITRGCTIRNNYVRASPRGAVLSLLCLIEPIVPRLQSNGLATAVATPWLWLLMAQGPILGLSRVAIYSCNSRPGSRSGSCCSHSRSQLRAVQFCKIELYCHVLLLSVVAVTSYYSRAVTCAELHILEHHS